MRQDRGGEAELEEGSEQDAKHRSQQRAVCQSLLGDTTIDIEE